MKISELIVKLEEIKKEHGDIIVCANRDYGDPPEEIEILSVEDYGYCRVVV